MVQIPQVTEDRSSSVSLAIPPPLRAKYVFIIRLDVDGISNQLGLTAEEQAALRLCERWPAAIQGDQWGDLLRWRFFALNEAAAVAEWDTSGKEWITFWEAALDPNRTLGAPRLVLDWGEGRIRLYAVSGRFDTRSKYVISASIDHTQSVLLSLSFPQMDQSDRATYRDTDHYDFAEKHGWEFPDSLDHQAEHCHGKKEGVEWWARLYDFRSEVFGKIVGTRVVESHPDPTWRTQFLVEVGAEGNRSWLPSGKVEPDANGNRIPPNGATVRLTLALNDEGVPEVARLRSGGRLYETTR